MNNKLIILALLMLAIGIVGGYWLGSGHKTQPDNDMSAGNDAKKVLYYRNPMNPAITSPVPAKDEMGMDYIPVYAEKAKAQERQVLFYRNPMNPAITSPVPAKDEMGMDYIPVYEDNTGDKEPAGTVQIDPVTVQNIGVRTVRVERRPLSRQLRALGRIAFNEERLARLHPKTSGWIEKLFIDETGTKVKRDTILLNIYSPDLVAAQREFLVALDNWEKVRNSKTGPMKRSAQSILQSARERLQLFDVPQHQIDELQQKRKPKKDLHIHSPFSGRVMNIGAREGQYVTPKDELYLIADLSRIWVYVDVYEDEMPWIKAGNTALMRVRAAPGKTFEGKVSFIYPMLDGKTRTVRVRLEFDNPDLVLKPGMFANVVLDVAPQPEAVVVPTEAIVRSGSREQVFVMRAPGKFEPREVVLGLNANGMTQVIKGVDVGEQVVVSSQFLIDSESKLREATAKMMEAMAGHQQQTPEHDAHNMDMDMDMSDMKMDDLDMSATVDDDMNMDDISMDSIDMQGTGSGGEAASQEHQHDHNHSH